MGASVSRSGARKPPRKKNRATELITMRVLPEARLLIDRAAELTGKNLTEFVLDAARVAVQNVLLDHSVIPLESDKAYASFIALLRCTTSAE